VSEICVERAVRGRAVVKMMATGAGGGSLAVTIAAVAVAGSDKIG